MNVITLIGNVALVVGIIGLGANALWANHLEAIFEEWDDEEAGLL